MPDHQQEKDEGKGKAEPGNKDALRVQVVLWNKNLQLNSQNSTVQNHLSLYPPGMSGTTELFNAKL